MFTQRSPYQQLRGGERGKKAHYCVFVCEDNVTPVEANFMCVNAKSIPTSLDPSKTTGEICFRAGGRKKQTSEKSPLQSGNLGETLITLLLTGKNRTLCHKTQKHERN